MGAVKRTVHPVLEVDGAGDDRLDDLARRWAALAEGGERAVLIVWRGEEDRGLRRRVEERLGLRSGRSGGPAWAWLAPGPGGLARLADLAATAGEIDGAVAYLPPGARCFAPPEGSFRSVADAVTPWLPPVTPVERTARPAETNASGWIAPAALLRTLGAAEVGPGLTAPALREAILDTGLFVSWASPRIPASPEWQVEVPAGLADGRRPPLGPASRVLTVIPHHRCEPWLAECLASVLEQTRPPDAVVVIDDASPRPPREIVARHPGVTLLTSGENVGPYRLVQTVVDATDFDAYLFQDADDWSARDRLEILLAEAERTGAELVGSQELRVMAAEGDVLLPVLYPLDVGAALAESPGHPLLHPTSLISRRLLQAVGGFATSLRFGGDTEMLLRAVHRGRAVNVPEFCYFRRRRADSLTTAPATGLDSPSRLALLDAVKAKALRNLAAARGGEALDLEPLARSAPAELTHVSGPPWPPVVRPRRGWARGR